MSFEKYEAKISLLNQRFWSLNLAGLIEDSKIYQLDLEHQFMDMLDFDMLKRFKKAYESCFNRRMVTYLILDNFYEAQITYREGLSALKQFSSKYKLNYKSEIATIIMDYARGNMSKKPEMSYILFKNAMKYFSQDKTNYTRRFLICQIDLLLIENILKKDLNYKKFISLINKLNEYNFLLEYIKATLKLNACRIVDYSRVNNNKKISLDFFDDLINYIEKIKLENHIILQNRELYMYNYLIAYFYIIENKYKNAKTCLMDNMHYINEAGKTYKIPLKHNLQNLETIQNVEWFQEGVEYSDNVYLIDSRFW